MAIIVIATNCIPVAQNKRKYGKHRSYAFSNKEKRAWIFEDNNGGQMFIAIYKELVISYTIKE